MQNTPLFGTEAYSAEVLANLLRGQALFVTEWGWMVWDGQRWLRDVGGVQMRDLARDILRKYYTDCAERAATPQEQAEAYKAAARACGARHIMHALEFLRGLLLVSPDEFDTHPYLLNCPNGVVDLRTGELLPHGPVLRLTKLCPTNYDPDIRSKLWESFLEDVFLGDRELIAYIQRALGYSITGETEEHKLFICWGGGKNGKSTTLEVLQAVLGSDYARTVPRRVLFYDKSSRDVETARAALYKLRLGLFRETAEEARLDEAQVIPLSGGDTIAAYRPHRGFFQFKPEVKLWLFTNHKPRITDDSYAMWRRIVLVPFRAVFTNDLNVDPTARRDPDPLIKEKLLQSPHREAILAWLVEGAVAWYAERELKEPDIVRAAVEEYQREQKIRG